MNINKKFIILIYIIIFISCFGFCDSIIKKESIIYENLNNSEFNSIKEEELLKFIKRKTDVKNINELREKEELHTALWNTAFDEKIKYKSLIEYKELLINNSDFLTDNNYKYLNKNQKFLSLLHQNLYPWLYGYKYNSLSDIIKSSNGKGIVICVPNRYFHLVRNSIDTFRNVLNTTLPIEIFYNNDEDLSMENRKILMKYNNIYISDISKYFNNDITKIRRWAIKPFAILASRFEEVILIDADAFYIKDPSELFNDSGYIEKGSLFFKDRTLKYTSKRYKFLKSFIINPLPETKELDIWNKKSNHGIESSTIVIHKTKALLGLLNVCKLNEQKIRDEVVYKFVYGDKETFWIGFEMSRQSYSIMPIPCAAIGKIKTSNTKNNKIIKKICGGVDNVAHTLRNKELLYWNGHIVVDKQKNINKIGKFEGYYIEDGNTFWTNGHTCLILKDGQEPLYFNDNEQKILNEILNREKKNNYLTKK